ncbi:hypothetical protein PIN31009_01847 [Pandoraea iniqua]|nr:hypothetical protein PIN31009_01847 [Pandoraea iniqua]
MTNSVRGMPGPVLPASEPLGRVPGGSDRRAMGRAVFSENFRSASATSTERPKYASNASRPSLNTESGGAGAAVYRKALGGVVASTDMSARTARHLRFADALRLHKLPLPPSSGHAAKWGLETPQSTSAIGKWALAMQDHAHDSTGWIRVPQGRSAAASGTFTKVRVNPVSVGVDGLDRQMDALVTLCARLQTAMPVSSGGGADRHLKASLRLVGEMVWHTRQALSDAAAEITTQMKALTGVQASTQFPPALCGTETPLRIVREGRDYFLKPAASHSLFSVKQKVARVQAEQLAVLVGLPAETPVTLRHLRHTRPSAHSNASSPSRDAHQVERPRGAGFLEDRLALLGDRLQTVNGHLQTLDTLSRPAGARLPAFPDDFASASAATASGARGDVIHRRVVMSAWDRS